MPHAGTSRPTPPHMRLDRKPRRGKGVWGERHPLTRFIGGVVAFGAVTITLTAITLEHLQRLFAKLGFPNQRGIEEFAITAGVLLAEALVVFRLARPLLRQQEVVCDVTDRTLTLRQWAIWRLARAETFTHDDVKALTLMQKQRGKPYQQLRLVLSDGQTRFIDEGLELEAMRDLAKDAGSALGRQFSIVNAESGPPFGSRFYRFSWEPGETRWIDLEYAKRKALTWVFLVLTTAALVGMVFLWSFVLTQPNVLGKPLDFGAVFGMLWMAAMACVISVLWAACIKVLGRLRLRGFTFLNEGKRLILNRGKHTQELTANEVSAVVQMVNTLGSVRRVELLMRDQTRILIDQSWALADHLADMARELADRLGVELERGRLPALWL